MGDYELDVYAKDRDGKELGRRNAGRFTYALDARIEAGSSRTEFSLDDLDTRVTGSVTAVHPRRNVRLPLAGANVRARLGNGTADVVSDAQGRFATSVAALGNETRLGLSVELASGDTETPGEVPVRTKTQQAVLTLSTPGPLTARYGSSVVLRGTLGRRAADGTVKPVAGGHVSVQENAQGSWPAQVAAGTDGGFTYSPTVLRTGTRVIRQPRTRTEFTTVRIAPRPVAKGQQLTVSGVLRTYDSTKGYAVYPGQKVRYYFQPDGSTVTQEVGTSVSLADGGFSKKFTAQTSGYWWIRFVDADAAHLATGYHPLGRVQVTG
ncbi:hypothetical protein [Streptomyces sp. NPDC056401]|uniref:hypothetical protein n=1 Tax=Streptomyces sp. NPDC056401 TaxID=3345809 RepID=UPI0035D6ABB8